MKLSKLFAPYCLEVDGNTITILNKGGQPITEAINIKRLGEDKLSRLAFGGDGIIRDESGNISSVFMYRKDADTLTPEYQMRVLLLSNLNVNQL